MQAGAFWGPETLLGWCIINVETFLALKFFNFMFFGFFHFFETEMKEAITKINKRMKRICCKQ